MVTKLMEFSLTRCHFHLTPSSTSQRILLTMYATVGLNAIDSPLAGRLLGK